ncbi:hypothetical protein [Aquimarina sp. MMG016]|uniref:hypothetical protein n=1 Tax=Aquimarina sp. MMG016 TaxID=2822690 RepID=UPI001FFCC380|nr:hypothetical protein [Aquimarina sp. MMG016]
MLPILISLVDRTYHYVVTGYFVNTSNTGVQIVSMPMFVADVGDYKIYDDTKKQEYFKYVYKKAVDRKVTKEFYVSNKLNDNEYRHFHDNYAHLSFGVLSLKGREFLNPDNPESHEAIIENNKLLVSMWLPLFYDNFSECIRLFYNNIIHAFGGFHMLFLHLLILISSITLYIKYERDITLFSSILMLYVFCNVLLVCLVEHSISRFFLYSNWMLPVLFVLLINKYAFVNKKNSIKAD